MPYSAILDHAFTLGVHQIEEDAMLFSELFIQDGKLKLRVDRSRAVRHTDELFRPIAEFLAGHSYTLEDMTEHPDPHFLLGVRVHEQYAIETDNKNTGQIIATPLDSVVA